MLIFYVITLKTDHIFISILSILAIYLLITKLVTKYFNTSLLFIFFNIFFFLFFLIHINSIIVFFLFIEIYSIIFYFFFLNNNFNNNNNITILKIKNNLLLYLFNNFIASIFFLYGINAVIEKFGTTNFIELSYLANTDVTGNLYSIVLAFFIKLSLPTVHYLKLEIYKYLSLDNVVFFSLISLLIYYSLVIFFLSNNYIFIVFSYFKVLNIAILLGFFFFIHKLKINNFHEFIAYSGYASNNIIILMFLVKIVKFK